MAKAPSNTPYPSKKSYRKALSLEAREDQLVGLAMDVVEDRMRNGTASSQEVVYFLKLGSSLANLQKKEIEERIKLDKAKIKAYESSEEFKSLYEEAIKAMKSYGGHSD